MYYCHHCRLVPAEKQLGERPAHPDTGYSNITALELTATEEPPAQSGKSECLEF